MMSSTVATSSYIQEIQNPNPNLHEAIGHGHENDGETEREVGKEDPMAGINRMIVEVREELLAEQLLIQEQEQQQNVVGSLDANEELMEVEQEDHEVDETQRNDVVVQDTNVRGEIGQDAAAPEAAITYPAVIGHQMTAAGLVYFQVARSATVVENLPAIDIEKKLQSALIQYQGVASGHHWDGASGIFTVERILGHRMVRRTRRYLIEWADEWNHPVWRSEVEEKNILDLAMLAAYKNEHRID